MTTAAPTAFTGFTRDAVQFLADLAEHNDRAWFQPRKGEYERLLKSPLEALCAALDERFRAHRVPLTADPARSPFRIYRDVRFSKDKSPYKTNIGASFRFAERGPDGTPQPGERRHGGGYFHVSPGEVYVGGGMWHPDPGPLAAWRTLVLEQPERVHAATDDKGFRSRFGEVGGDRFKRPPAGVPADHPDLQLLNLKDITFGRRLGDAELFSADLPEILAVDLGAAAPLLRLLANLEA
ncbi:MAG TPA: DUF2461 domain-containing protein [Candidatus Acidoferrales bacterium]|nr:DUF2461 domain-containing protein [Candidatus Acidoferrales bacterium]